MSTETGTPETSDSSRKNSRESASATKSATQSVSSEQLARKELVTNQGTAADFPLPLGRGGSSRRDFADVITGANRSASARNAPATAGTASAVTASAASAGTVSAGTTSAAVVADPTSSPDLSPSDPSSGEQRDRGEVIGSAGKWLAGWALRFIVIAVAAWVLLQGTAIFWSAVLPIILALIVCTILWPVTARLRGWKFPPALAVLTTILGFFLILGGIIGAIAPSVARQSRELVDQGAEGIQTILDWMAGPPLNIEIEQLNDFIDTATEWVQGQASAITQTALSGASAATSAVVTVLTVLVLTFFFLKDGEHFLPLVRRVTGRRVGWHLTEILCRCWRTLGSFIRTQAIVSFIDAFFIGIGLFAIGVPLAGPLAIITFFGGFIPIVGALSAGALSVLVALVANGFSSAVAVLVLIIAVQQLEGNILSPTLQSKAMNMHAVVVLLSVTVGGGLFGIIGAFLAVPAAAMISEVVRYLGDLGDIATGEKQVDEVEFATIVTRAKQERIEAEAEAKKNSFLARLFSRSKKADDAA
ncbi:MAG: AI-2E family transporter [Ancrocorticia sp.]